MKFWNTELDEKFRVTLGCCAWASSEFPAGTVLGCVTKHWCKSPVRDCRGSGSQVHSVETWGKWEESEPEEGTNTRQMYSHNVISRAVPINPGHAIYRTSGSQDARGHSCLSSLLENKQKNERIWDASASLKKQNIIHWWGFLYKS